MNVRGPSLALLVAVALSACGKAPGSKAEQQPAAPTTPGVVTLRAASVEAAFLETSNDIRCEPGRRCAPAPLAVRQVVAGKEQLLRLEFEGHGYFCPACPGSCDLDVGKKFELMGKVEASSDSSPGRLVLSKAPRPADAGAP